MVSIQPDRREKFWISSLELQKKMRNEIDRKSILRLGKIYKKSISMIMLDDYGKTIKVKKPKKYPRPGYLSLSFKKK